MPHKSEFHTAADGKTIFLRKSPIQEIRLMRLPDRQIGLFLNDAVQFVTGDDDRVYHGILATMPGRMMRGRPFKALILGGGDGLAARNLLKFPNLQKVKMVELDPGMIDMARTNPFMRQINEDSMNNPRVEVQVGDAREFVNTPVTERFDIALLDFPDPSNTGLMDLFGVDMMKKVSARLTPMPVMAAQSSSAFSNTEDSVMNNMLRATGRRPIPVRFKGDWMAEGVIVMGGRGVIPGMTKIPYRHQANVIPSEDTFEIF